MQKHGLDVSRALSPAGTGLVWATISAAATLGQSEFSSRTTARALLQITNLGISVKDSSQSTLVFVTRLDSGLPVRDARVAIVDQTNVTRWRGTTDGDGVALVPALALRSPDGPFDFRFIVTAEKDGDAAFVDSNWGREANLPSTHRSDRVNASGASLRGTVFADRGVYKESEEVHLKAVVREDTPTGMRLLPPGSALDVVVRNAYRVEVDRRRIAVNRWSSTEWTWRVPDDAWALGKYSIELSRAGTLRPDEDPPDVEGSFVVAAFPQPTFRVDATLTADTPVLGSTLQGTVSAKYLAGGVLGARPLRWSWLQDVVQRPPAAILERYPPAGYAVGYLPESRKRSLADERLPQHTGLLGSADATVVALPTVAAGDLAYSYTFEVDVEDESGHHIAGRAGLVVHPASLYVAISRLPKFVDTTKAGQTVGVAAVDLSGRPVADVPVTVSLVREEWVPSVRQRSGWERREISAGEWTVRTATGETPLPIPLGESGRYILRAIAHDATGRQTRTEFDFYALGPDLSSWRSEGNQIYLTPERETWKPGETARILIHSPWPRATALVTVEREGVRSHRVFTITSTQDTVDVPITAADAPNVYVSVMLVRGRTSTGQAAKDDPSFRVGYTELSVVDPAKRLRVDVSADRDEYPPGGPATLMVAVTPGDGKPAPAEVTLWAIDQALLSLTGYTTPDLLKAIYTPTPLQVMTTDNRQQLVSRGPMRMLSGGVCCGVEGGLAHGSLSLEGMLAEARRRLGQGRVHGRTSASRRPDPPGFPAARLLARLGRHRRRRPRHDDRHAAGLVDDVSDHGGRGKRGVTVRIGRARDPRDARPAPAVEAMRPKRVVQSQRLVRRMSHAHRRQRSRHRRDPVFGDPARLEPDSCAQDPEREPGRRIWIELADAGQIRIVFSEPMVRSGSVLVRRRAALDSHHAGGRGELLLVGDEDTHLLAGRIGAVAVRHALHRARRRIGGERGGPFARRSVRAHVHDADGPAALG